MKSLRTSVLCAVMALSAIGSFAQGSTTNVPINEPDYNRPKLFAGLPDKIQVNTTAISTLFNTGVGQPATIALSADNQQRFSGQVISTGSKSQGVQTVVIRSTNFAGATFSISKTSKADGSVTYRGRIISFKHGDFYDLVNQDGQYVLVKKNFYDLVNE